MKISLIICTYQRAIPLLKLLQSVEKQSLYPHEILVIDGSYNEETKEIIQNNKFKELKFFKVSEEDRGLTRQRNFGIGKANKKAEIICFLDDDTILEPDYFEKLINTYKSFPDAIGVGGYILNDVDWSKSVTPVPYDTYEIDGYIRKLGSRNLLRKRLGLLSHLPPGKMPEYSHGLSTSFLPPSGEVYPVDFFMGGVASYRKSLFDKILFSSYFIGYGLYEDMDFCLRSSKFGPLYVNTAAQVYHYHEESGRPNKFKYGKMVLRNGWYVWRVKFSDPSFYAIVKWHLISGLLILVRMCNAFNGNKKSEAIAEAMGRVCGWINILIRPPKLQ